MFTDKAGIDSTLLQGVRYHLSNVCSGVVYVSTRSISTRYLIWASQSLFKFNVSLIVMIFVVQQYTYKTTSILSTSDLQKLEPSQQKHTANATTIRHEIPTKVQLQAPNGSRKKKKKNEKDTENCSTHQTTAHCPSSK